MKATNRRAACLIATFTFAAAMALSALAAEPAVEREIGKIDAVVAAGPYQPDWASLEKQSVPAWYLDGKFGIFIHWGVYSRARLRQRVVSAEHVRAGLEGVQAPRGDVRPASGLRL